jgi:C1A family cysteine protease
MTRSFLLTITVLLGLCSLAAASNTFKDPNQEVVLFYNIFKDWISQSQKQYGIEELSVRFFNWKSNYDFVVQQNSNNLGFRLEMNDFADMTNEEFGALHLGFMPELQKAAENTTTDSTDSGLLGSDLTANLLALPKKWDWRKEGIVSPVKNQGSCGGCWAFSATGALEGLYAIKNNNLVEFSEQQMIDCSADYGNQGCDGGLMTLAFQYTRRIGAQPSSDYGYTAKVEKCKHDSSKALFRISGHRDVPANNSLALKAAVARQPVAVGIEASGLAVQLFKSGVIAKDCSTALDHAVLIVGYDTDASGQDYWIVKNSWGAKWGQKGYMNIARGSHNKGAGVCGINMMATYPVV